MTERQTQYDLESSWITPEGIAGVNYAYGAIVRIRTGEHRGETAEVIALLSLDPEPQYGVVLPPNEKFVLLTQSDLEDSGQNSGRTLTLMKAGEEPRTSKTR